MAQSNSYLAYFKLACLDSSPTYDPTFHPTAVPSSVQTADPTSALTSSPSSRPADIPRTRGPTPSLTPTVVPTMSDGSPTPQPTSGTPTIAPTLTPTSGTVTSVVVPVVQALVGITQSAFESSLVALQAFENTVESSLGSMQGAHPDAFITGYIPMYRLHPLTSMTILDVVDPTGVKVKFDILFVFVSRKTENSIAELTTSINATLIAAARSVSGGTSPFSMMLTTQFLNITDAKGSMETNPFSGVTTPAPIVSAAVVTETTQVLPVTAESKSSKSNQVIIGAAVGVGCFFLLATAAAVYVRYKYMGRQKSDVSTFPTDI